MLTADQVQVNSEIVKKLLTSPAFTDFVTTYNVAITASLAFVTIAVIVFFFVNVTKFSASGDNQMARHNAMSGILICVVCFMFIGGIDVVYAILTSLIFG